MALAWAVWRLPKRFSGEADEKTDLDCSVSRLSVEKGLMAELLMAETMTCFWLEALLDCLAVMKIEEDPFLWC